MPRIEASRKRWGRVSAKPSEYLIKLRRGEVTAHGPGLSVFLWPSETYTIIPMAVQRVSFVADQVTAEKVGICVTGVAVYRVADPLLAFRVLDFDDAPDEDGLEPLGSILAEMFIGAARRLVANMSIEDCLTRRKEAIAQELMTEILPVVSGRGRPDDRTNQGWGVVVDTIEIQDVRILSEHVFAQLQAPYRASLELKARSAEMTRDRELSQNRIEAELEAQNAEVARDRELHQRRVAAEREALETSQALARERATIDVENMQARSALDAIAHEAESLSTAHRLEIDRLKGELETELKRRQRDIDNTYSDERIRYELVARGVPAAAEALAKTLGQINITHFASSGENKGISMIAESVMQFLALARNGAS